MDITGLFHPQARARRNAVQSLRAMQIRRGEAEEAERAVIAAAAATGGSWEPR